MHVPVFSCVDDSTIKRGDYLLGEIVSGWLHQTARTRREAQADSCITIRLTGIFEIKIACIEIKKGDPDYVFLHRRNELAKLNITSKMNVEKTYIGHDEILTVILFLLQINDLSFN